MPGGRLEILWVTPTLGARFGGPSTTTSNGLIAERLAGLDSRVVSTIGPDKDPRSSPVIERLREAGVPLRLFRRIGPGYRLEAWGLSLHLAVWLLWNVRRYDVVHLQYVWCMSSIVGAVAARLSRVPLVITPHESLTDFDIEIASRRPFLRWTKKVLRHFFLRSADQLVLMSELEARGTRPGRTGFRIISHAVVEDAPARSPQRRPYETREFEAGLRIAFLGRRVEKKGLHLLVEAVARHPERNRQLVVAGPPALDGYEDLLRQIIADLGVGDRVTLMGFVPDREAHLTSCDLLAMPSRYEGFGMVAAEAMSLGLPVVVPRRSGVAELVDEFKAGLIMEESTVDQLDAAFSRFELEPELLCEMGARGAGAAETRLAYSVYATGTSRLWEQLATRSGRPARGPALNE